MLKWLVVCLCSLLYSLNLDAHVPNVLVSIAPYKFFVEKIAEDTVNATLIVPAGASAHTYEPSPRQIMTAGKAIAWFCIGESFESRVTSALKAHHPEMMIIDLRKNVDMIKVDPQTGSCCCHANSQDLHVWLSIRQVEIQLQTMTSALSSLLPENTARYQKNLALLLKELNALDQQISALLKPLQDRLILVSHPAYAYFCRDYGLAQLSIEFEGKDPTPQQVTTILNKARAAKIKKVYIQMQYNNKGARLFAKELGAEVVLLDPYSEHYFASMLEIALQFSKN